jgi:glutamine amidotransferase
MIAVIDYGAGNLQSVKKALDFIGAQSEITADARRVAAASGVILPGVGAFGNCMESMRRRRLLETTREAARAAATGMGVPFLGICLGQQLLFGTSEESPGVAGLAVLPGDVVRFHFASSDAAFKIPHMGWNSIAPQQRDGLLSGVPDGSYVYFVHSYFVRAARTEDVSARAEYGVAFDAAVQRGNLAATQFHPEKSGDVGLAMLRNFAEMTK